MHDVNKEVFDRMMKIAQELRAYKRKHRHEIIQKFILVVLLIILIIGILSGTDDSVETEFRKLFRY